MPEEVKPAEVAPAAPPKLETPEAPPKAEPTLMGGEHKPVSEGEAPKKVEPKKEPEKAVAPPPEKPAVPEKYELKIPEGSPVDQARVEKISAFAKEKGLSNEQAQMIVERESDAVTEVLKNQDAQYQQTKASWREASLKDPEIAGDEAKLKESVMLVDAVMNKYGSQALRDALNATGLGNHPELMRLVVKIGREMGPAKLIMPGSHPEGPPKPTAHRVWGYMNEGKDQAS